MHCLDASSTDSLVTTVALCPEKTRLLGCIVIERRHQRDEACGREVDVTDFLAQPTNDVGKTRLDLITAG